MDSYHAEEYIELVRISEYNLDRDSEILIRELWETVLLLDSRLKKLEGSRPNAAGEPMPGTTRSKQ